MKKCLFFICAFVAFAQQVDLRNNVKGMPTGTQTQYFQIQPNTGNNNTFRFVSQPGVLASDYNFPAQTPGGSLIIGNNPITLKPVPLGVNGTDVLHSLWVTAGTGTAEACSINGGSGVAGDKTGTIIINCAHTHTGNWTISSAFSGIPEAMYSLPNGGIVTVGSGTFTPLATTQVPYSNITLRCMGQSDACILKMPTGGTFSALFKVGTIDRVTFDGFTPDGNLINTSASNTQGIFANGTTNLVVRNNHFKNWGYSGAPAYNSTNFSNSAAILCVNCWNARIYDNYFNSDWAYDIHGTGDGAEIHGNHHGTPNLSQVNTTTSDWDTQAGGVAGVVWSSSKEFSIHDNFIWGANRFYTPSFVEGNPITTVVTTRAKIANNYISGMTPLPGTCSVTSASATVICSDPIFMNVAPTDVGMALECETAVGSYFKVATINSTTNVTITPVYSGTSSATARCRAQIANDAIQTYGSQYATIIGNTVFKSGDMGIDLNMYWDGNPADNVASQHNTVSSNNISDSMVCGITLSLGTVVENDFVGNKLTNNHQGSNSNAGARGGFCMSASPDSGAHMYVQAYNTFTGNSCIDTNGASPTQLNCIDIDTVSWGASAFTANMFNGNLWLAGGSGGFSNEPIAGPGALSTALPSGVSAGPLLSSLSVVINNGAGAQTYTAASMVNGILLRDAGALASDVTASATALVNQVSGAVIGTGFAFALRNMSAGANTITLTAGASVTLSGPLHTVLQNQMRNYWCTITNVTTPAVTCYSMGTVTY